MTTDPLTWSPINLGRWGGTVVRVHVALIIFVACSLLGAAVGQGSAVLPTACWLGLLILALAAHEFGHAATAHWLGAEPEEVRLWPLGNMVGPTAGSRSNDNVLVALGGPALSASLVLATALALWLAGAQFVWSPFGNDGSGAPIIGGPKPHPAATYSAVWFLGWFGYLNWVILLANLIPALPFDGGRVVRGYLAHASAALTKDGMFAPYLARGCAVVLFLLGLFRLLPPKYPGDGLTLITLAVLIEWMVRTESRMIEDGGFFDDGVFGYDFSEGYTSLEGSAAKVRPYRESAIKRWRRRRSELRRQRRQLREAAEDRRMDEILDKLHREGRAALSDEEHRFLVRVSVKIRNNKPRAGD